MTALQTEGVMAATVLRMTEFPDFPFCVQRRTFRLFRQDHIAEPFHVENAPTCFERLPDPPLRSA